MAEVFCQHSLGQWAYFTFRTSGARVSVPTFPTFDPADGAWFSQKLSGTRFYLEFGSGGSTLLAGRTGCKTVSIESDPRFAEAVARALPSPSQVSVVYADIGLVGAWGYPVLQRQTQDRLALWRGYTSLAKRAIESAGCFPDLVLVDGRFRVACALSVAAWASEAKATTTIMFDDYRERPHYHKIEECLGRPEMIPGRAGIFQIKNGSLLKTVTLEQIEAAHSDVR